MENIIEDRIPPQALDSERMILASALYDAGHFAEALRSLLPIDFYDSRNAALFAAMRETGTRDPLILSDKINGASTLETSEEKQAFVFDLLKDAATTTDIGPHVKRLKDMAARRQFIETATREIEAAYNPEVSIIDTLGRAGQTQREILKRSFENDIENRVYVPTWENCPANAQPLMELSNVRILSRGNLAMLTACAGAGKSSVMEASCTSILSPMSDTLGLCLNAKSLLYIDTERSRHDHNMSWQRFLRRSGIEQGGAVPAAVRWENIKGIENLNDRLCYLWSRLDADNVPEIVLLDGIGDFIADPNDSDECTRLVYRLGAIADTRNIGLWVSLHNNPAMNSDKARGVLGSELWRKAESVLIIEKTTGDDVRRLTTDYSLGKNRGGNDAISSYFKWDNEQHMHVSCAAPKEAKGKTAVELDAILQLIETRPVWSHVELCTAIEDKTGKSERTAKIRIATLTDLGKITKSEAGIYSIANKPQIESPDYVHN